MALRRKRQSWVPRGKPLRLDAGAKSASPKRPAFLARPAGAPVYHGFPLIEETRTEGWCFGAITDFLSPDSELGCTYGDGYVEAPDGTRAGLVWEVGQGEIQQILPPEPGRWGVYAVWFSQPVRSVDDLLSNFRGILPALMETYSLAKREEGGARSKPPGRA